MFRVKRILWLENRYGVTQELESGETFSRDIYVLELASSNMDNLRRLFPGEQNAVRIIALDKHSLSSKWTFQECLYTYLPTYGDTHQEGRQ